MNAYSYARSSKTAASVPTLKKALGDWMNAVAKEIASTIPAHLKADGVKVEPGVGPNYAGVDAKGYSKSDLEGRVEFGLTIDNQPFRLCVFAEYNDDDVNQLTSSIARWLKDL